MACLGSCWDQQTAFHVGFGVLGEASWSLWRRTRCLLLPLGVGAVGVFCVGLERNRRRELVLVLLRTWAFSGVGRLDGVSIALLSQEELALECEFLLFGFRGHNGVEVGFGALLLGTKDAAETLGFFLSRTKGP